MNVSCVVCCSELFRVVEDMLSVLIHGTLVSSDSSEKGEENRKTYTSLTRKLKVSQSQVKVARIKDGH